MEAVIKKENKKELKEMLNFIKSLSPEQKQAFNYMMYGFKAATNVVVGKEVN